MDLETSIALRVSDRDNVATIFANGVLRGGNIEIRDKRGDTQTVQALSDIPYAHKIAVRDISKGEGVLKYGEEIGVATRDIRKGEHVHVHNMDSMRGRGDLAESEGK